jgi:hypothetical protein
MDDDHRVRLPPELFEYLAQRARRNYNTVSGELRQILRELREQEERSTQEASQ